MLHVPAMECVRQDSIEKQGQWEVDRCTDISRNQVIQLQRLVNLKFIGYPGTLEIERHELMLLSFSFIHQRNLFSL